MSSRDIECMSMLYHSSYLYFHIDHFPRQLFVFLNVTLVALLSSISRTCASAHAPLAPLRTCCSVLIFPPHLLFMFFLPSFFLSRLFSLQPTNHLDHASVAWLTQYLQSQQEVTCLIVSHDTLFLDNVVTDIIHYETVRQETLSYFTSPDLILYLLLFLYFIPYLS